jgi:hypothetical protein
MGEPKVRVRPLEARTGEIRMTDLGTTNVDGKVRKPGVTYVMGRNEAHLKSLEKPMWSVETLVPAVLRGVK